MDKDSTQQTNQQNQPDSPEVERLYQQLSEVATANRFLEREEGRLWVDIATQEITRAVKDISSDKYEKDHAGYLKRLADLQAYKTILRKMQVAADPRRRQKIQERLGLLEEK